MSDIEYTIYDNVFQSNDKILEDLKLQLQHAGPIFNSKKNDNKRCQCNLKITKTNKDLVETLTKFIKTLNPELTPSSWVLIKSKPGCKEQLAHIDYENTEEFQKCINEGKNVPLLVLVALQPNTYIYLWKNSSKIIQETYKGEHVLPTKLELKEGEILVFRADLVHAGSDYEEENIRMHCYLDSPVVKRNKNRTYIISKHGNEYMNKNICV